MKKKDKRSGNSTRGRAIKPTVLSIPTSAVQIQDIKSIIVKVDSATAVKRMSVVSGKTNKSIKVDVVKVVNDFKIQQGNEIIVPVDYKPTISSGSTGDYDDPTGGLGHIMPIISYKKAKIRNRFKRVSKRTSNKKK